MKLHATKAAPAVIPTASMADIAFLLIIFFMITFVVEVDRTQVTLPQTHLRYEIPRESAYVSVTEAGQIRVSDGEEMSYVVPSSEDVLSFGRGLVQTYPDRAVVLKADEGVPYRVVDEVIDSLKQARVRVVYLLSQQDTIQAR